MMKKIMLVANCEFTIFNFRKELIDEMKARGHNLKFISPDTLSNESTTLIPKNISAYSDDLIYINLSRGGINPIQDLSLLWSLYKIFKAHKPDIVLNYTIKPTIYSSIAAGLARVPGIYSNITGLGFIFTHNSLKTTILKRLIHLLYRFALLFNTKVFFQNEDDRSYFTEHALIKNSKTKLINGSGVNTELFEAKNFETDQVDTKRFLFVGRLLKDKGIFELLEAAQRLEKERSDFTLQIIGSPDLGNPNSLDEKFIHQFEGSSCIKFLGHQKDVSSFLSNAGVFILPSYREGTPRSTLEALASSMPVITTDAPGCRSTVNSGVNGFLVPVKDSEGLYLRMKYFLEHPEQIPVMGAASRKLALEKFDVRLVNRSILETINA